MHHRWPERFRLPPGAQVVFGTVSLLACGAMSLAYFGLATACTTDPDCVSADWTCSPCDGVRRAFSTWAVAQGALLTVSAAWTVWRPDQRRIALAVFVICSIALFLSTVAFASAWRSRTAFGA